MSFSANGIPWSAPRYRPAAISASACFACWRARSNVRVMNACVCRSYCSTRRISASTSSRGDSFRAALRLESSAIERTGEMNEIQLRELADRWAYLTELEERKRAILDSITGQGKLTDDLKARIESCLQKNELEDLYLPYKPKRRTRATIARERGLDG